MRSGNPESVSLTRIRPTPTTEEAAAIAAAFAILVAEQNEHGRATVAQRRGPRLAAAAETPWRFSGRDW